MLNLQELVKTQLSEKQCCAVVCIAAAFNSLGLVFLMYVMSKDPMLPLTYQTISALGGFGILLFVYFSKIPRKARWAKILFVGNATLVSIALYDFYSNFGTSPIIGLPFQSAKLGTLMAAVFAPDFVSGLAAVLIHAGSSIFQYQNFSPELKEKVLSLEPWALIGFAMGAVFILIGRFRVHQIQKEAEHSRMQAEAAGQVAKKVLEIRDIMNTPLQSIELASALLAKADGESQKQVLSELMKACTRLRAINETFREFESSYDWKPSRGGLGDETPISSGNVSPS